MSWIKENVFNVARCVVSQGKMLPLCGPAVVCVTEGKGETTPCRGASGVRGCLLPKEAE